MTPQAMMQIKSFKIVGSQVVSSQFHVSLRMIEGYSAVVRACCCVSSAVDCTRWRTIAPAVQGASSMSTLSEISCTLGHSFAANTRLDRAMSCTRQWN
jgi:hypothetical protein